MAAAKPLLHVRAADSGLRHSEEHTMTSTVDTNAPTSSGIAAKRATIAFAQRLTISALAVGAILLGLSAPVVHAGPDDGPGSEPGPPYVPSAQTQLTPPPIQASQNPVVFDGAETKKNIGLAWTPYKWAPVRLRYKAVGGTKYAGHYPPVEPSVADPHFSFEVTYGRTYQVYLETTPWPPQQVGPTLTITTVRIELASTNPPPPRVNPRSIPGFNPQPDPPSIQRLDPGAAGRNTREEPTSGAERQDSNRR
jgi:hypothetical protein